jgi:hypothetical protein
MKELPILFNTEMVQAILEGRKTQTRRAIKPQPKLYRDTEWTYSKRGFWSHYSAMLASDPTFFGWTVNDPLPKETIYYRSPYGAPGDLLYVREGWKPTNSKLSKATYVHYRADAAGYNPEWNPSARIEIEHDFVGKPDDPWRPSIHMPKKFARIWLEVKDMRVERLQDISEKDAEAEGVSPEFELDLAEFQSNKTNFCEASTHVLGFKHLWDSINAKRGYGWDTNPFCWVVEFEKIDK